MAEQPMTDKQKAFLEALGGEALGDVREAMNIAGYAKSASINTTTAPLVAEITKIAEQMIAQHSIKAVLGITGVLANPVTMGSEKILMAAKELLDRAGIVKKDKLEITASVLAPVAYLPAKNRDNG